MDEHSVTCTHCGTDVPHTDARYIVAQIRSARIRVEMQRAFCGERCRETWWNTPDGPMFTAHTPEDMPTCEHCEGTKNVDKRDDGRRAFSEYLGQRTAAHIRDESPEVKALHERHCHRCSDDGKATPIFFCSHNPAHSGHFDRDIQLQVAASEGHDTLRGRVLPLVDGKFGCPCDINDYWQSDEPDALSPKDEPKREAEVITADDVGVLRLSRE